MKTKPSIIIKDNKKMWLMPDGDYIPYIAGGSDDTPTIEELQSQLKESESKTKEAREDAAKYRIKLREKETSFDGVDLDEYNELKKKNEKEKKNKAFKKGEYEKLIAEKTLSFEEKTKSQSESISSWRNKYESKVIDDSINKIAVSSNAVSSDDVATFIKSKYKAEVLDSGVIKLSNLNGEALTDGKGNPLSLESAVKELLDDRSYLVKSSEFGSGSNGGTGKHTDKNMSSLDKIKKGLQNL